MFLLPFMFYGAVITKKLNVIKQIETFFLKFEVFSENHPPTRHIKYKRINFAASNN